MSTTTESRISPFSSGSQYDDWTESNCRTCTKAVDADNPPAGNPCPCDIEQALLVAYFTDGLVPLEIADRMGRSEGRYGWPCKEHDPPFENVDEAGRLLDGVEYNGMPEVKG